MWSLGSVEVVWGLGYQLEKFDEVVTAIFTGIDFEVMDNEVKERRCSLWWERQNHDGVAKLSKLSLDLIFRQQFRKFRPELRRVVL